MASVSTSDMQLGYFLRDNCCFNGLKDVIYVYTTTTTLKKVFNALSVKGHGFTRSYIHNPVTPYGCKDGGEMPSPAPHS